MPTRTNRQWILQARPKGMVEPSLFELRESPVPELVDGQVLAQTLFLSFDPSQRAWMAKDTYMPAVPLGEIMRAGGIAQVIESRHRKSFGWSRQGLANRRYFHQPLPPY